MVTVTTALQTVLLRDADTCVKCGLCLPHCPTYRQTGDEGESPRGRIALLQNWALEKIPLTARLEQHVDGCLSCNACEVVCPAKVPFGRIMDRGREALAHAKPQRVQGLRLLAPLLTMPALRTGLLTLLWLYQKLGMSWLIRRFHLLGRGPIARLESYLPPLRFPQPSSNTASKAAEVGLFVGCTGSAIEPDALQAATALLKLCGYRVNIPGLQGCCGALHQHAGLAGQSQAMTRRNVSAFAGCQTVASFASGCAAQLADSAELNVRDIHSLLLARQASLRFRPLRALVALHTPCTLRNVLRADDAVRQLLQKIPGLEVIELDATQGCCGAAGSYFLTQPQMADALLAPKIEAVKTLRPDLILSSNVGCSLHLAAGLRREGVRVPVRHPLVVLAQQAIQAP